MSVRVATPSDIPFMVDLAVARYGSRIKDRDGVARWLDGAIRNPDLHVLRTDAAIAIGGLQRFFYDPVPELRLLYLLSASSAAWSVLRLLRALIAWGRALGCTDFILRNATEFDLGPLARRLGRTTVGRVYSVSIHG